VVRPAAAVRGLRQVAQHMHDPNAIMNREPADGVSAAVGICE